MSYCSIKWCGKNTRSSKYNTDGISFHRFPKDPKFKQKWIKLTKRENWFPMNHSVVCSRHFTEDCFIIMKNRRRLLDTSVPTLSLPKLVDDISESELSNSCSVSMSPSPPASPKPCNIIMDADPLELPSSQLNLPVKKRQIKKHTVIKNKKQSKTENNFNASSQSLVTTCSQPPESTSDTFSSSALSSIPLIATEIKMNAMQLETPSQLNARQVKRQLIRRVIQLSKKIVQKNKQTKNLREKVRYYKKKVASLNVIIKELEVENLLESQKTNVIKKNGATSKEAIKKEDK